MIQFNKVACAGFFLFLLSACSQAPEDGYYIQNFDNLRRWTNISQVTYEQTHSAGYCTYVDSSHEFSQTFEMDWSEIQSRKYKSVQVTAWCWKPLKENHVSLVAALEGPQGRVTAQSVELGEVLEATETWINVLLQLKLPDAAPEGSKFKVYLFSPKKEKAFMDDVVIQFRR